MNCEKTMIGEKRLVKIVGGPMDGYDWKIAVHDAKNRMTPAIHHRRDAGADVERVPVYERVSVDTFQFVEYRDETNWVSA
jgi:hypothetical protein